MNQAQVMAAIARGDVIAGLANCHKQGVYSLVLQERKNDYVGMVRVFYASKGHGLANLIEDGDFALLPHNHRQSISLQLLWGCALNHEFKANEPRGGWPLKRYEFSSAIVDDHIGVTFRGAEKLSGSMVSEIGSEPLKLEAHHIHTVQVPSETAAWVVIEGAISKQPSLCRSFKSNLSLTSEGLYLPMNKKDIAKVCNEMVSECRQ